MKVHIEHIVRKRRGFADVSERDVDLVSLSVGRSGSADIHLADPRVRLDHATIEHDGDRPEVRAIGDAVLLADGKPLAVAALLPGVRIAIGPYELRVAEPPPGFDLALAVELVQPFDAERASRTEEIRTIDHHLPRTRVVAWALSAAVLVIYLVLPVIAALSPGVRDATGNLNPLSVWNSGAISNAHRGIAEDCTACHAKPFVRVENAQCLACHAATRQHADPKIVDLGQQRCESCHKEHNGQRIATRAADAFCTGCHGAIAAVAPATNLVNVESFATAHPQFRPMLVTDASGPVLGRVSLDSRPMEGANLRFPHDKHLRRDGLRTRDGSVTLVCASCHVPDRSGTGMRPVTMEGQCGRCHTLAFEWRFPDWSVPHGEPEKARRAIAGLYSQLALSERREIDRARPERQRPGEVPQDERTQRESDRAWVEARTEEAMTTTFGASGCGLCHAAERNADGWSVRPVHLAQSFMPKARFDHARHTTVGCAECHTAQTSSSADDVLMPGIATCRGCHGGETPGAGKVASGCVSCHAYHSHPMPIRAAEAAR